MYPIVSLGETAEKIADDLEISRKDQDKFALESQQKAIDAINQGNSIMKSVLYLFPKERVIL